MWFTLGGMAVVPRLAVRRLGPPPVECALYSALAEAAESGLKLAAADLPKGRTAPRACAPGV